MNRLRRFGKHTDRLGEQESQPESADSIEADQPDAPAASLDGDAPGQADAASDALLQDQAIQGQALDTPAVAEDAAGDVAAPPDDAVAPAEIDTAAQSAEEVPASDEAGAESGEAPSEVVDVVPEPVLEAQAPVDVESPDTAVRDEPQTAPFEETAEREELTPLPVNAVIDGRYVVQSQLHHSPDRNLYRVSARHQQRCPACGRLSSADEETCPNCGAALAGQPPAEFYLMAESFRPEALMQDPGIMDLRLYHPNLVPVVDFYSYKPFGNTRYYAVAEPRQGVRLSQLSLPRSGMQVFNWAMQLADALDYLHSRGVVGAGAEADDILVQGDRASLASLQNAKAGVESSEERTQQQSMDLARLASTIYEAYTGHPAAMGPDGVLPMPPGAPEQVGAALRAAIEPAQGIAPPIGAARWRSQLSSALEAVSELERPGRPVDFVAHGLTSVGRLRDLNEDSYGMAEFVQASVERPMRMGLYIIADGMGGHKGGEVASALAVETFCSDVIGRIIAPMASGNGDRSMPTNETMLQGITRAVQSANDHIYKGRDNRQNDMGTTLVAALIASGKAYMVNIGDSRLYMYSQSREGAEKAAIDSTSSLAVGTSPLKGTAPLPGHEVDGPLNGSGSLDAMDEEDAAESSTADYVLTQVSVDHSLVHRLVELGQLDPEEAKVHPHRNFIYRSLGGPSPIEVDTFVRTLHPDDRLLLCSDGLNSMIEDDVIEGVLASEPDPQIACQRLIELANEAGGHDNITVMVIDVKDYLPLAEHPTALNTM